MYTHRTHTHTRIRAKGNGSSEQQAGSEKTTSQWLLAENRFHLQAWKASGELRSTTRYIVIVIGIRSSYIYMRIRTNLKCAHGLSCASEMSEQTLAAVAAARSCACCFACATVLCVLCVYAFGQGTFVLPIIMCSALFQHAFNRLAMAAFHTLIHMQSYSENKQAQRVVGSQSST